MAAAEVKTIQQQLGHQTSTVALNTNAHLFEGDPDEIMDRLDTLPISGTRAVSSSGIKFRYPWAKRVLSVSRKG